MDGLQERGLVERLPDPHDRRATLVQLRAARAADAEGFFGALSATDRDDLTRILRVLRG